MSPELTEFKEVGRQFIVVFKRKRLSDKTGKTDKTGLLPQDEGVSEGVNILYNFIKANHGQRVPHFTKALKVPTKTLERWLKILKAQNKIIFRGSPKKGGYYIV